MCFENNAAGFFSERVVLVEGDSDVIFFGHISTLLNKEWDFNLKNIALIRMNGKSNYKRYKDFFERFDVDVHAIFDIDAIIEGVTGIYTTAVLTKEKEDLFAELDAIALESNVKANLKRDKIKEIVSRQSFKQRFEKLIEMVGLVTSGEDITDEQAEELELLFEYDTNDKRRKVIKEHREQITKLDSLLGMLREQKIYVLSKGDVEGYYPAGVDGQDKPSRALSVCKLLKCRQDIEKICPLVKNGDDDILEFDDIFNRICASSAKV